jgi:hypothetical protein
VGQENHVSDGKRHTAGSRGTVIERSGEPCCQVEKRHTAGSGGTVKGRSGEPCCQVENVTQLGQEELS